MGRVLRRALDALYLASGAMAAAFMLAMLGVILLQMSARWTGYALPGSTDYAGYCMAGASFLGLAYALNRGSHIYVGLMLTALGPRRLWGEIWRLAVAALLATYLARYAVKTNIWSSILQDVSQGQDATPLWIPQLAMSAGTVILAIALWDNLICAILYGRTNIVAEELQE